MVRRTRPRMRETTMREERSRGDLAISVLTKACYGLRCMISSLHNVPVTMERVFSS
jgi:hypothetical protein